MKKVVWVSVLLLLLVGVGAYFYFAGKEYVVRITEAQIKEKLESKLPFRKRYLFIIELTLNNPRVHLENGTNRVASGLDAILNIKINDNQKSLGGTIDISGNVSYLAEQGEFFLIDPVIENLQIQGIPEEYQSKVNVAASKALADYFDKNPIYTLRRTNLKQAAARAVLKNVTVENQELVVTLGI